LAEFIPDRLPSKASRGEERTFALLKKLPDDYLVYYEPNIDNRHPDFIVIAPDLGVIIIEVKGWYLDDIVKGNHSEITINTDNVNGGMKVYKCGGIELYTSIHNSIEIYPGRL